MRIIGLYKRISTLHFIMLTPKSFVPYTQSNNKYALFPYEIHSINGMLRLLQSNHYTESAIVLRLTILVVTLNEWHWYIWFLPVVTLNKQFDTPSSLNSYTIFKVLIHLIFIKVTLNILVDTSNSHNNYSLSIFWYR